MTSYLRFTPLTPLIARDSRPFGVGQGNRIRSLGWLTQSVLAGAVRSTVWKADDTLTPEELKKISVLGGFPIVNDKIYFPRPLDLLLHKIDNNKLEIFPIRPMENAGRLGIQMPGNILPSMPVGMPDDDFKPEKGDAFWSSETMIKWLEHSRNNTFQLKDTLPLPSKEERTHVTLDFDSGAAEDTKLFSTAGLDFVRKNSIKDNLRECTSRYELSQTRISVKVDFGSHKILPDNFILPLGGERRLVRAELTKSDEKVWNVPQQLAKTMESCKRIRMILTSPAIFEKGWLPGWIGDDMTGVIPNTQTRVRLVSAVVDRWKPISGWNYEKGKNGPKALRRMVPAGSVYFFEVIDGNFNLSDMWLSSVCDEVQDRLDGFGLTLWGCY